MRQFITAALVAAGLIALWAAILPLTAEPASTPVGATPPAFSKAMFLCRGPNGIDRACSAALAQALVLDATDGAAPRNSDHLSAVGRKASANPAVHD